MTELKKTHSKDTIRYDFSKDLPKRHTKIGLKGWHPARIHQAEYRIVQDTKGERRYFKISFLLLDITADGRFIPCYIDSLDKRGQPNPEFEYFCQYAGLRRDYGYSHDDVLQELVGCELEVFVNRYKTKGNDWDRVDDYKPLTT